MDSKCYQNIYWITITIFNTIISILVKLFSITSVYGNYHQTLYVSRYLLKYFWNIQILYKIDFKIIIFIIVFTKIQINLIKTNTYLSCTKINLHVIYIKIFLSINSTKICSNFHTTEVKEKRKKLFKLTINTLKNVCKCF